MDLTKRYRVGNSLTVQQLSNDSRTFLHKTSYASPNGYSICLEAHPGVSSLRYPSLRGKK